MDEKYFEALEHQVSLLQMLLDLLKSEYMPPPVLYSLLECVGNIAKLRSRALEWLYPNKVYDHIHRLLGEVPRRCTILEGDGLPIGGVNTSTIKKPEWVQLYAMGMWAIEKMMPESQNLKPELYEQVLLESGEIALKVLRLNMEQSSYFSLRILKAVFQVFRAEDLGPDSYNILPDELPTQLVNCYKETTSVPLKIQCLAVLGVFFQEDYSEQARDVLASNLITQLATDLFNEPTGFSKNQSTKSQMESELDDNRTQMSVLNKKSTQYLQYLELAHKILNYLEKFIDFIDDEGKLQLVEEIEFKSLIITGLVQFTDNKNLIESVISLTNSLVYGLNYPDILKLLFEENDCQTLFEIAKVVSNETAETQNTELLSTGLDALHSMILCEKQAEPPVKKITDKLKLNEGFQAALQVCMRHPKESVCQMAYEILEELK